MNERVAGANFRHVMRGGRGWVTGNPAIDAVRAPSQKCPQEPKPVIGSWEADAYVEMELQGDASLAKRCGFTVGQTPGSQRALEELRRSLREEIYQRYIVED